MKWNEVGSGFCEGKLHGYPEYANSITSWFMVWIGLWGVFGSTSQVLLSRQIYSAFIINGVGSFLYHYYGYAFYGSIDVVPMLIASWFINQLVLYYLLIRVIPVRFHETMNDLLSVLIISLLTLSISINEVSGIPIDFSVVFAIPNISTAIVSSILLYVNRSHTEFRKILIYTMCGFFLLIATASLWVGTEPRCDENSNVPGWFAITHAFWHIGFSWGAHLVIQSLMLHALENTVYYTSNTKWLNWLLYYPFPLAFVPT